MNVLIVARTQMQHACCVGGYCLDTKKNVRLLNRHGRNQPNDTPFEVGQVWELRFEARPDLVPPHVEDVLVFYQRQMQRIPDLSTFLSLHVRPWVGPPDVLFDRALEWTRNGTGFIERNRSIPDYSVGFWRADRALKSEEGPYGGVRYRYSDEDERVYTFKYVGQAEPRRILPAQTLLRVSLARWWRPNAFDDERCFLQLSGWYL